MNALSVTKFNSIVRDIFNSEELLHNIQIVGEVFGVSRAKSAVYFSLKDEESSLPCVTFNSFLFENVKEGDLVTITGSPNFYVKGGRFNFVTYNITLAGQGLLYQRFVELKNKLEREGLFSAEHKKLMPHKIKRIGVVTSKDGAVIEDIKNVAWRRNPSVEIVLYPCKVQGIGAEKEIVDGINFFSNYDKVDAVIVARGGGSLEDLSAYNTEMVARAVFNSNKFLVSAVGHEVDFTIVDFVSDLRAPTPSAAAELLTEDRSKGQMNFRHLLSKLSRALTGYTADKIDEFNDATKDFQNSSINFLEDKNTPLKSVLSKLNYLIDKKVMEENHAFNLLESKLGGLNPTSVLRRGYAKVEQGEKPILSALQISEKEPIDVHFFDGQVTASVMKIKKTNRKN